MDSVTANNAANYNNNDGPGAGGQAPSSAVLQPDKKTVVLTFGNAVTSGDGVTTGDRIRVSIGSVILDCAGGAVADQIIRAQ